MVYFVVNIYILYRKVLKKYAFSRYVVFSPSMSAYWGGSLLCSVAAASGCRTWKFNFHPTAQDYHNEDKKDYCELYVCFR